MAWFEQMPQEPIIIPIIIAGITLGSLLASESHKLATKKLLGVSLLAGLLNLANAFLVYQLTSPPTFTNGATQSTFTGGGTQFRAAANSSPTAFYASSFLVGFLIVLAIVGIALAYAKFKGPKTEEEIESEPETNDLKEN